MHRRTWKKFEQKVAEWFGSTRTPLSGGNSKHTRSDSLHNTLYIECKKRKSSAAVNLWLETAIQARAEDKIPVVCLSVTGKHGFWILCHADDLTAIANQRTIARAK